MAKERKDECEALANEVSTPGFQVPAFEILQHLPIQPDRNLIVLFLGFGITIAMVITRSQLVPNANRIRICDEVGGASAGATHERVPAGEGGFVADRRHENRDRSRTCPDRGPAFDARATAISD
jgi:hypothetical protein